MTKLPIVEFPDERLTTPSAPVRQFNIELSDLIDNLTETLYATTGIGLSAPQVGRMQQVMVMDLSDDHSNAQVFINPTIVSKAGFAIADEACLSLPGINAKVIRSAEVVVSACNKSGIQFETTLNGMSAICLQHELDHLNGILFTDRISALRRLQFRSTFAALRRRAQSESATGAGAIQGV